MFDKIAQKKYQIKNDELSFKIVNSYEHLITSNYSPEVITAALDNITGAPIIIDKCSVGDYIGGEIVGLVKELLSPVEWNDGVFSCRVKAKLFCSSFIHRLERNEPFDFYPEFSYEHLRKKGDPTRVVAILICEKNYEIG